MGAITEIHLNEHETTRPNAGVPEQERPASDRASVGIVVIGRNLGARLERSIRAAIVPGVPVVYVDSGSADASVAVAHGAAVIVIELDASRPFTAARGRNEGFARLGHVASPAFVMFVDGDVELAPGWIERAGAELAANPGVAVVTGHLREHDRATSVLARVCDMDWSGPVGDIEACGGVFMVRSAAFERVGGFNPDIPTGEEAELCARLRRDGWIIRRIDAPMGEHDAGMTRFSQWWGRTARVGEGYVAAVRRSPESRDRSKLRRIASNVFWGAGLPAAGIICACAAIQWPWAWSAVAVVLLAYLALWVKIMLAARRRGRSGRDACLYATFCLLAKWAHLSGHVRAWVFG